jgi:hypothetical protein
MLSFLLLCLLMDVMCRVADVCFLKLYLEITKSKAEKLNHGEKCMQCINLLEGINSLGPNYIRT